jgi:hypothetical protein
MTGARVRRILARALLVALVASGSWMVRRATASHPPIVPAVGSDIKAQTRTCIRSWIDGTPSKGAECRQWTDTGPANVVIIFGHRDPYRELVDRTGWRPANGNWAVLQGYTNEDVKGPDCGSGWRDSTVQAELRLSPVSRRHLKFIYSQCTQADGTTVAFSEGHTDVYDITHCGGDYAADWDRARDDIVKGFRQLPRVTVQIIQQSPRDYDGGCHVNVHTDGRIALITLQD